MQAGAPFILLGNEPQPHHPRTDDRLPCVQDRVDARGRCRRHGGVSSGQADHVAEASILLPPGILYFGNRARIIDFLYSKGQRLRDPQGSVAA